jgi:hypothetical protein
MSPFLFQNDYYFILKKEDLPLREKDPQYDHVLFSGQ